MIGKDKYYIVITYNDNFLYFVNKNSTSDGHIGFTRDIKDAKIIYGRMSSYTYKIFIKRLENTFRDYGEILAHPNIVIMKGKTYEDIHYFKDKITLFNMDVYFKNYDTKQLRVVYDITIADIRKFKLKKIFGE
jgi:hypothetical protein